MRARPALAVLPASLSLVVLVLAGTLAACGGGMLAAAAVGALGDGRELGTLVWPGLAAAGFGLALLAGEQRVRSRGSVRAVAGLLAVALAWALAAAAGSVPFVLAGTFDSPLDALFEAMSGFTTTGATLLERIEAQPDALLMWRSLMQWLGGVGIVVLVVAVAPFGGPGLQRVFQAETSGIAADRLTPRIADTAKIIAGIYAAFTVACATAYAIAGMDAFDAVNHSFTTIATGGFSTRGASLAAFDSLAVELIAIFFMIVAAINFAFYWRVIKGGGSLMPQLAEVRIFLGVLLAAVLAVAASLLVSGGDRDVAQALRDAGVTVVAISTSTGYTTVDFDLFGDFARVLLIVLMFVGACAGSTAGGIKVIRVALLVKASRDEVEHQFRPSAVRVLRLGRRTFGEDVRRTLLGFFLVYAFVAVAGTLAFALAGLDLTSSIGGMAATLNIIGPALGDVGATETYAAMPPGGRAIAIVLMLAGRLEVLTIVVLLYALVRVVRGRAV